MSVCAKMWVDGELVVELPGASLIRCVHPRTQFGHQYQLYGVQVRTTDAASIPALSAFCHL